MGAALGAFVAFYTGMLLMSSGSVPFWDTLLLPMLFTVSAFDTGVALVEVIAAALAKKEELAAEAKHFMECCVVVLVAVEAVVLAAFLGSALLADASVATGAAAAASASMFVSGQLAGWFWGLVVVVGLVAPFCMALRGLLAKKGVAATSKDAAPAKAGVDALALSGAAGALIGGCALRFLVLAAGVHATPMLSQRPSSRWSTSAEVVEVGRAC